MKTKPVFIVWHDREVRKWVLRLLVKATNWLAANYRIPNQVTIHARACGKFKTNDGRFCSGAFFQDRREPIIWVAVWYPFWLEEGSLKDRDDAYLFILEVLFHEFRHYQQLLCRQPQTHRNMWPRVRTMMRRFLDEPALDKATTIRPRRCKKATRTPRVSKKPTPAKVR